ncbi:MAG: metallophosphatase family protein [Chitinophagales bacterium]|nr:metallophosphatase family protein [Chitinophagales bacterium]
MKRIGLLSDTHSFLDIQLKTFFADCDEIWHAGDIGDIQVTDTLSTWKPVRAVYGNIDDHQVRITFPEYEILELEGIRILLIHIAGAIGKYNSKVRSILKQNGKVDALICGHSHILKIKFDEPFQLLHINPGAAGKHGFHQMRTALKLELNQGKIENMSLIELGKRGVL